MALYKVLIVDDEPSIRLTFAEFLRRAGYEPLTAADCEQAEALLSSTEVDVAVIDINLPRRNGFELLHGLARREPYVPVIMITGEPDLSQLPKIVRAGAYDFLAKPVVKETILAAVARAAEKKRLNDEKRRLESELSRHADELERRVEERTAQLAERSRQLAEAHGFLNLVLDSSTEYAILALDASERITLFNRGAELIFGYDARDLLGRHPCDLLPGAEERPPEFLRACLAEAAERGHSQGETSLHRSDGTQFPALVTITPIGSGGRSLGYLCVIRDLTAEREAAASLREMEARLAHQERIAALGRVAAQVAHEVKNPLAGLLLYSLHLRGKLAERPAGEKEVELVDSIVNTVNHLMSTVEQIMNYARPLSLAPSEVDLNAVVRAALELLRPQMETNRVELITRLAEGGTRARLDESSIRSTVINLVLNAVQAMPDGGRLEVSTARDRTSLTLEIADTGRGMTEEEAAHIFEPFYTTKSQGLGLGMPYAKKVVEQHGGELLVESRPGEGTCLRVLLPAEPGR